MNYAPVFSIAARTEAAFKLADHFLANNMEDIEAEAVRQLKEFTLKAVIATCQVLLAVIDWAQGELDKRDEYVIRLQIAQVKAKRFVVRRRIAVHSFIAYNGLDKRSDELAETALKVWQKRGAIARTTLDTLFCLG